MLSASRTPAMLRTLLLVSAAAALAACGARDASQVSGTAQAWTSAEPVQRSGGVGDAVLSRVAMDGAGNAFAVWRQTDGYRDSIWASRCAGAAGWADPVLIETDDRGSALEPQVAAAASGDAMAVWQQSDGARNSVWANRYAAATGWGDPVLVETSDAGSAFGPHVAMDAAGDAAAVWYQLDGSRFGVFANRHLAGAGWGAAERLSSASVDAGLPRVAIDPSGSGVAVWLQTGGTATEVWASRLVAGGGWSAPERVGSASGGPVQPQTAVDGGGNAVAVWKSFDGSRWTVRASRYQAGAGWGAAQALADGDVLDAHPQVASDASGAAVAVWEQSDGARYRIWSRRWADGAWEAAEVVDAAAAGDAVFPSVAMDGSGNAIAAWRQYDAGRWSVSASRYVPAVGWSAARAIEPEQAGDAVPQVAAGAGGAAVAVWHRFDGTRNTIRAARYQP